MMNRVNIESNQEALTELSVVIPVFNEADNIEPLVRKLTSVMQGTGKSYEIILVDDGSTDGSFDTIKEV